MKATLDGVVGRVFETSGVGQTTPMPENTKMPGVHCGKGSNSLNPEIILFQSRFVRAWSYANSKFKAKSMQRPRCICTKDQQQKKQKELFAIIVSGMFRVNVFRVR
jgi:hypothetical protein